MPRGNSRMREMIRTYEEPRPRVRAYVRPVEKIDILEIPEDGRSTFSTKCPNCGWNYRHDLVPAVCYGCEHTVLRNIQ